ncbi:MAG: RdgB/HAM1 family non-canonical purine NTP pyrophosphatase [Phycisphaerales bacterium JB043]
MAERILVVATSNTHKLEEIDAVLAPTLRDLDITLKSLADVTTPDGVPASDLPEPVEDADTFAGNAAIKATTYARALSLPCLADDSGLEVDALDGAPGVYSARYAGIGSTRDERDQANNAKLLDALKNTSDDQRSARFVCELCFASPTGDVLATSRGTFEGTITHSPRGTNGFGYDPLLELPEGITSAELDPVEKNKRSHRARALDLLKNEVAHFFRM